MAIGIQDLKNRGMEDCFIACIDGLKGLPEAIEAIYPHTEIQLCIVHKVRNTLKYVPWKDRKAVAADLRAIYAALTLEAAEQALEGFSERWDDEYPAVSPAWRADWHRLTVLFDYPPEIRGAFPTDESIVKVLYLRLNRFARKWTLPIRNWKAALNQFVIMFGDRV
ncbi:MAG: putative transposase [Gammaproteobacteria bacterium]